jgi:hypothetical protein
LGIGLALGILVAGAFEILDVRFHSAKAILKVVEAEVIGEIPMIVNESDARSSRRKLWLGWATAVFVCGTILAGSAYSYFHG